MLIQSGCQVRVSLLEQALFAVVCCQNKCSRCQVVGHGGLESRCCCPSATETVCFHLHLSCSVSDNTSAHTTNVLYVMVDT